MLMPEQLEAGGICLPVVVSERPPRAGRRSARARGHSARATLGPNVLAIRLPADMASAERDRQLTYLMQWAQRAVARDPERFRPRRPREYRDGDVLEARGRSFRLSVRMERRRTGVARMDGDCIALTLPADEDAVSRRDRAARLVSRVLAVEFHSELVDVCRRLHRRHFSDIATPTDIRFRFTTRRWGSCSARGHVSISTRLLLAPPRLLEYVCVHELGHLVHLNHSPAFWDRVAAAFPGFRDPERWLRRHALDCQF